MWPGLSTTSSFSIILLGLLQTICFMSIPVSLRNKGCNDSCWKVGKDRASCLQSFSLYGKLLPNHFTAWYVLVYLIKVIDCIWDKFFDLENVEKTILNFMLFCMLSWWNCWSFHDWSTELRLLLQFREENVNIDLNYWSSSFRVKRSFFTFSNPTSATAHFQVMDHKFHFRFSHAEVNKSTLVTISLNYSCSELWNTDVL